MFTATDKQNEAVSKGLRRPLLFKDFDGVSAIAEVTARADEHLLVTK
jgi:hypothetical protein